MNLDKSNWKKVKLGDVAFEYSKRVEKPSESGFDRFVGSANIGRFDFRVLSWESTSDVESSMKQFQLGDYLLVRRSLYASDFRERSPRADFDGICSGDILTIRENPEMVVDGFLIGILNSPPLWQYIVANASGSITRRIKWRDLVNYEFLLPPKGQQAKLAELLWSADSLAEKYINLFATLGSFKTSLTRDRFSNLQAKTVKAKELCKLTAGGTPSTSNEEYWKDGSIPWMSSGDVHLKRIYNVPGRITQKGLSNSSTRLLPVDSVVIALAGQGKTKGTVGITKIELCTNQSVAAFMPNPDKLDSEFLYHYLDNKYREFRDITGDKNSRTGLNLDILGNVAIPLITLDKQQLIKTELNRIDSVLEETKTLMTKHKNNLTMLINQIFS